MFTLVQSGQSIVVPLNRALALPELIQAGDFRFIHRGITEESFPAPSVATPSPDSLEVHILSIAQGTEPRTGQVLSWMEANGFRTAGLWEMLGLAAICPRIRLSGGLWALGSLRDDPDGAIHVPGCTLSSERKLRLSRVRPEQPWSSVFDQFLCLRV